MKRIFTSVKFLLFIATLFFLGCDAGSKNEIADNNNDQVTIKKPEKITVMNPAIANPGVDRVALTKRIDSLENKTLYLVDINWGGPNAAYGVFKEMETWFSENMPNVKVVLKRKSGSYMSDDPALWKEIGEKGDAAIVGISG